MLLLGFQAKILDKLSSAFPKDLSGAILPTRKV